MRLTDRKIEEPHDGVFEETEQSRADKGALELIAPADRQRIGFDAGGETWRDTETIIVQSKSGLRQGKLAGPTDGE